MASGSISSSATPGRLGGHRCVDGDVVSPHGLIERGAQRAVHVVDGSGGEARGAHFAVELFDVLGFQLGDPVSSDPGIRFCAYVTNSPDEGVRHRRTTRDALIFFL
jgi:hypothetical protein